MLAFNKADLDWNWNCKSLSEAKNRRSIDHGSEN